MYNSNLNCVSFQFISFSPNGEQSQFISLFITLKKRRLKLNEKKIKDKYLYFRIHILCIADLILNNNFVFQFFVNRYCYWSNEWFVHSILHASRIWLFCALFHILGFTNLIKYALICINVQFFFINSLPSQRKWEKYYVFITNEYASASHIILNVSVRENFQFYSAGIIHTIEIFKMVYAN